MPDEAHPRRPDSDRRLRQASRFARVLRVLEMIQGRAGYGVKEMAAEFGMLGADDLPGPERP